jgi:hypothetical protein
VSYLDDLDPVSRYRSLTDNESDALWSSVRHERREPIYRRWTHKENAELMKAARKRGGVKDYAERTGRSYASVQSQLRDLKQQRRRRGIAFVGRFFYDGEVGGD